MIGVIVVFLRATHPTSTLESRSPKPSGLLLKKTDYLMVSGHNDE